MKFLISFISLIILKYMLNTDLHSLSKKSISGFIKIGADDLQTISENTSLPYSIKLNKDLYFEIILFLTVEDSSSDLLQNSDTFDFEKNLTPYIIMALIADPANNNSDLGKQNLSGCEDKLTSERFSEIINKYGVEQNEIIRIERKRSSHMNTDHLYTFSQATEDRNAGVIFSEMNFRFKVDSIYPLLSILPHKFPHYPLPISPENSTAIITLRWALETQKGSDPKALAERLKISVKELSFDFKIPNIFNGSISKTDVELCLNIFEDVEGRFRKLFVNRSLKAISNSKNNFLTSSCLEGNFMKEPIFGYQERIKEVVKMIEDYDSDKSVLIELEKKRIQNKQYVEKIFDAKKKEVSILKGKIDGLKKELATSKKATMQLDSEFKNETLNVAALNTIKAELEQKNNESKEVYSKDAVLEKENEEEKIRIAKLPEENKIAKGELEVLRAKVDTLEKKKTITLFVIVVILICLIFMVVGCFWLVSIYKKRLWE